MTAGAAKTAVARGVGREIEHGALSFGSLDRRPFSSCAGDAADAVNAAEIPVSGVNLADARGSLGSGSLGLEPPPSEHPRRRQT